MTTFTGIVLLFTLPVTLHGHFTYEGTVAERGSFGTGKIEVRLETDTANQYLSENASSSIFTLTTIDKSTIETQSRLTFSPQSCDTAFYEAIEVEVTTAGNTRVGTFAGMEVSGVGVPDEYHLEVELSSDYSPVQGESCSIVATLETWQVEFSNPNTGFSDVGVAHITFSIPEIAEQQETTTAVADTSTDESL